MQDKVKEGAKIDERNAAERNKGPIFEALVSWLAGVRHVLEVGAGDGTHARHACAMLTDIVWQTSEAPGHHRRLVASLVDIDAARLPAPIALDVRGRWPDTRFDAVFGANVAHIMDWAAVEALFAGAAAHLSLGGLLCLYGPFVASSETLESGNAHFDAALRARDPAMGLREIGALDAQAEAQHMTRVADIAMPADNRLLIWRVR